MIALVVAAAVFAGSPADAPRAVHLTGAAYYESIGRPELARDYRVAQAERVGLFAGGAVLVATGLWTIIRYGITEYCDGLEASAGCQEWRNGYTDLGLLLLLGGAFALAGAGVIDPDPVLHF